MFSYTCPASREVAGPWLAHRRALWKAAGHGVSAPGPVALFYRVLVVAFLFLVCADAFTGLGLSRCSDLQDHVIELFYGATISLSFLRVASYWL